jgi:hypothetical protein
LNGKIEMGKFKFPMGDEVNQKWAMVIAHSSTCPAGTMACSKGNPVVSA